MNTVADSVEERLLEFLQTPAFRFLMFLTGNIFSDTGRADHLAGGGAQNRIIPSDQAARPGTSHDFIFVMPGDRQIIEQRGVDAVELIRQFGRHEKVEPIAAYDRFPLPAGESKQVIVAISDPRVLIEHHRDKLEIAEHVAKATIAFA